MNLSDDFVSWAKTQLKDYANDVKDELGKLEPKKSLAITLKLKLKKVGDSFKPSYHFSIPRAAVKADSEPDRQLELPGM